mmetsp:Transcript_19047/g.48166  ORF Transcript_19047/g.48166 Transcript_19047/m.48166 type:complete len:293 (+) Transcript_19047:2-880(+)
MTVLHNFIRVDVDYFSLKTVNGVAGVFGPLYFFSFVITFGWVFTCVLLAVIYNAWHNTKETAYRQAKLTRREEIEREYISKVFASGLEPDRVVAKARHRQSGRAILSRMARDRTYRAHGRDLLCERMCARPRSGWMSKERVLIHLKEWKALPANRDVHFLDFGMLRDALGGKRDVPQEDQVQYFFNLLKDRTLDTLQVEQRTMQLELDKSASRSESSSSSSSSAVKAAQSGPSLSMRKSLATTVQTMGRDEIALLLEVDRHLTSLRVRQEQAALDSSRLSRKIEHLVGFGAM